jgi:hypothetical protein
MKWERRFSVSLIAEIEGVTIWAIYHSISGGIKRAEKFYKNFPKRCK